MYPCPCCGYITMSEPPLSGSYEICDVCYWENDPIQYENPHLAGGANTVSLHQARINFNKFGASTERRKKLVRPPRPEEIPPEKRGGK